MRIQSWRAAWSFVFLAFAGTLAVEAQPHLVADLNQERVNTALSSALSGGVEHDGVVYFAGHDPQHGSELWRTDGTSEGTYRLTDLCPGSSGGLGEPLGFFAGYLYFRGDDCEHGFEIWRTDGTVGGEEMLAELCTGDCVIEPRSWLEWRGALWFLLRDAAGTAQVLWTSDGTAENTRPAADLCADLGICDFVPDSIFLVGPNATGEGLFLWVYSTDNPMGALFRTDGTASSSPGPGVVVGRIALFPANDLIHGRELFATDGTKEGTRLVADLNRNLEPNPKFYPHHPEFGPEQAGVGSDPSDLVRAGSNVFFVADDGRTGRELWVTNGTRRGTGLVSDLSGGSQARELTLVRGKLFFAAFLRETGAELWTSKGTAETTHRVADLHPGPFGSQPQNLKAVGDRVVFAAEDGISGLEPWTSDGTAEGTLRWGDIAPGSASSNPGPFSLANGQILFGADDGEHGRELWAMPVAELPQ
ncbi:MAG TPA: hypothetical protein VGS22_22490 [Thermoanaerobaculia bacterium]|jgi:ELWxxDGT repeat protein|nr:hypothetical protein [Thermoanaerobaculia bacterium]